MDYGTEVLCHWFRLFLFRLVRSHLQTRKSWRPNQHPSPTPHLLPGLFELTWCPQKWRPFGVQSGAAVGGIKPSNYYVPSISIFQGCWRTVRLVSPEVRTSSGWEITKGDAIDLEFKLYWPCAATADCNPQTYSNSTLAFLLIDSLNTGFRQEDTFPHLYWSSAEVSCEALLWWDEQGKLISKNSGSIFLCNSEMTQSFSREEETASKQWDLVPEFIVTRLTRVVIRQVNEVRSPTGGSTLYYREKMLQRSLFYLQKDIWIPLRVRLINEVWVDSKSGFVFGG